MIQPHDAPTRLAMVAMALAIGWTPLMRAAGPIATQPATQPAAALAPSPTLTSEFTQVLAEAVVDRMKATGVMPEGATKPQFVVDAFDKCKQADPDLLNADEDIEAALVAGKIDEAGLAKCVTVAARYLVDSKWAGKPDIWLVSQYLMDQHKAGKLKGVRLELALRILRGNLVQAMRSGSGAEGEQAKIDASTVDWLIRVAAIMADRKTPATQPVP
jgi:hypothetical protein